MIGERTGTTRAWLEVNLDAVVRNATRLTTAVRPARMIPMVKADAYGLGATEVARALVPFDPYAFGVATVEEGVALRESGIEGRIIVFSPCGVTDAPALIAHGLDASILGIEGLERLTATAAAEGARLGLHLEIDTGIGRAGLPASECAEWAPRVAELVAAGGRLETLYSHFHSSGTDEPATRHQLEQFEFASRRLEGEGIKAPLRHIANSDAIVRDRRYHLDLVRPGLYLYGGLRGRGSSRVVTDADPVARVCARVLEVRRLPTGSTVSYGARYVTRRAERVATVAIGYADGMPWRLSNQGEMLATGRRVPIRGAVCMDLSVIDVSRVPGVEAGGVVTLLGEDDGEEITLNELARLDGTIEYEVLTGLGRALPRVYRGDAERLEPELAMSEAHGRQR